MYYVIQIGAPKDELLKTTTSSKSATMLPLEALSKFKQFFINDYIKVCQRMSLPFYYNVTNPFTAMSLTLLLYCHLSFYYDVTIIFYDDVTITSYDDVTITFYDDVTITFYYDVTNPSTMTALPLFGVESTEYEVLSRSCRL